MNVVDVLALTFFFLVVLDCATTAYGLAFRPNLAEANPLVKAFPMLTVCFVKIGLTVALLCLWRLTLQFFSCYSWVVTFITLQALIVTLTYLCIVVNNLCLILTR